MAQPNNKTKSTRLNREKCLTWRKKSHMLILRNYKKLNLVEKCLINKS